MGDQKVAMPVLDLPWADERQWCRWVHEYLATGQTPVGTCPMLKDGICLLTRDKPCLLSEPPESEGWQKARRWAHYQTPDGQRVLVLRSALKGSGKVVAKGFLQGSIMQLPIALVETDEVESSR